MWECGPLRRSAIDLLIGIVVMLRGAQSEAFHCVGNTPRVLEI